MILAQDNGIIIWFEVLYVFIMVGCGCLLLGCFFRAKTGSAIYRNGAGSANVFFSGMATIPVVHNQVLSFRWIAS